MSTDQINLSDYHSIQATNYYGKLPGQAVSLSLDSSYLSDNNRKIIAERINEMNPTTKEEIEKLTEEEDPFGFYVIALSRDGKNYDTSLTSVFCQISAHQSSGAAIHRIVEEAHSAKFRGTKVPADDRKGPYGQHHLRQD